MRKLSDHDLEAAFRLAYCLHPDETWKIPALVVSDGLDWKAKLQRDQERRPKADAPYKQKLPELALLQLGIFRASHDWECDQESAQPKLKPLYCPTTDDLLVRYLKLLVWKSCILNSCHVAVSLGCYLYRYDPNEISDLAPDCFGGNIPRVNTRPKQWIAARFPQGTRFPIIGQRPPTPHEEELLQKALLAFAPWGSQHLHPAPFFLTTYFGHNSPHLDKDRIHALIDPACAGLPRLIGEYNDLLTKGSTMRLDDANQKLEIPEFDRASTANSNDRFAPDPLSPRELALLRLSVQHRLEEKRQREKSYRFGWLSIRADGEDLAQFDARLAPQQQLTVPASAAYLEIFGQAEDADDLLLAVFPLPEWGAGERQARPFSVELESGEKLELIVSPPRVNNGESPHYLVQLRCVPLCATSEPVKNEGLVLASSERSLQAAEENNWRGQWWKETLSLMHRTLWPMKAVPRIALASLLLASAFFVFPDIYRIAIQPPELIRKDGNQNASRLADFKRTSLPNGDVLLELYFITDRPQAFFVDLTSNYYCNRRVELKPAAEKGQFYAVAQLQLVKHPQARGLPGGEVEVRLLRKFLSYPLSDQVVFVMPLPS